MDITMATEVLLPCFFYITELQHCARNYITCALICFLSILSIYLDLYGFKIKRNTFHWFKMVDARWRMVPGPSLMIIYLFYRYGGHIEFIRFKEYYGMHRGHLLSIYARFSAKKRTSLYISREKRRSLSHPNTVQRSFFPITIFFEDNVKKNWPEKRAYIYWASISDRAHAPWASHSTP